MVVEVDVLWVFDLGLLLWCWMLEEAELMWTVEPPIFPFGAFVRRR